MQRNRNAIRLKPKGRTDAVGSGAVDFRRISFQFRCIGFGSCESPLGIASLGVCVWGEGGGAGRPPQYFVSMSLHFGSRASVVGVEIETKHGASLGRFRRLGRKDFRNCNNGCNGSEAKHG